MIKIEKIQSNNKFSIKLFDKYTSILPTSLSSKYTYSANRSLTANTQLFTLVLYQKKPLKALAFIHIWYSPIHGWVSPLALPFGGIISLTSCPKKALLLLLQAVELQVMKHKGKQITITTSPSCYAPDQHEKLKATYLAAQFKYHQIYLNHHIAINPLPFENLLSRTEKSRLRKCEEAQFLVQIISNLSCRTIYDFISSCRLQKNYSMPISYKAFEAICLAPSQHITVFGAFENDHLIAISVTARVNSRVLYNYLPAYAQKYAAYSPIVFLMRKIYEYCQEEKVKILDLGISLDHLGKEKPSLIRFKKNIGGIPSEKITYIKHLDI